MEKVRLLIVGEREFEEEYLAELVDDDPRGHHPPPHPIVRILRVLRYPRQRAIMMPEVAHSVPPVKEDTVCRMQALREATKEESGRFGSYGESLRRAWEQAMREARSDGERELLRRQQEGKMQYTRRLVEFRPWEIKRIRSNDGGERHAKSSESLF